MGRFDEALTEIRRAQEIDPLSLSINHDLAAILIYARRYDEAITQCRRTLELEPNHFAAWLFMGAAYESKKMYAEAVEAYLKADILTGRNEKTIAALKKCFAQGGWTEYLRADLSFMKEGAALRLGSSYQIATIYARLGEKDQAFAWLEKAYQDRGLMTALKVDPKLDALRSDPRMNNLLKRVGLAQ